MSKNYKLNWTGDQAIDQVLNKVAEGFEKFGLRVESNSKQELKPNHGVKTGTLRRSIHLASPDYNWKDDDIAPSQSSPELGGGLVTVTRMIRKIVLAVGSGLSYAMAVHQGHGSFDGYHYITNGLAKSKPHLKKDIESSTMSKLT